MDVSQNVRVPLPNNSRTSTEGCQGQGVTDADTETVRKGGHDAVSGGKGLGASQNDAVDHDEGYKDTQLQEQGIGIGLHDQFHNRDKGSNNDDKTGDPDLGGNDFPQGGNQNIGAYQHESCRQTHTDAVFNRLGYCQHRAQPQYESKWWNLIPQALCKLLSNCFCHGRLPT